MSDEDVRNPGKLGELRAENEELHLKVKGLEDKIKDLKQEVRDMRHIVSNVEGNFNFWPLLICHVVVIYTILYSQFFLSVW